MNSLSGLRPKTPRRSLPFFLHPTALGGRLLERQAVWREICLQGYTGSYMSVYRALRNSRIGRVTHRRCLVFNLDLFPCHRDKQCGYWYAIPKT